VVCGYSTDARILTYDLRMLRDDRRFFPPYDAAPIVRGDLLRAHPEIRTLLAPLASTIDDATMRRLNHAVDELGRSPVPVAANWISGKAAQKGAIGTVSFLMQRRGMLWQKVVEHLTLTGLAMAIAIAIGVPAGVLIHRYRAGSAFVLAVTEIVQTIPSLAMLAFLFAVYGMLGKAPAVTALVLYALLPIVLNTFTALKGVPSDVLEAAEGVGMSRQQRLRLVELPLALPVIIAGIRTSTVWTVGIATLSICIGAGGLGDFIARGLARNDARLTLLGAAPAALIAVVLSLAIRLVERRLTMSR
jgi:osmoprotectant transport system permease protein